MLTMMGVKDLPEEKEETKSSADEDSAGESPDTSDFFEDLEPAESDAVVRDWGGRVARALGTDEGQKDWLVYSLATQYWRIKGDPVRAVECSRKALYLVPRYPPTRTNNILL